MNIDNIITEMDFYYTEINDDEKALEKKRKYMEEYRKNHKDIFSRSSKLYYLRNRDRIRERNYKYRAEHYDQFMEYNKTYNHKRAQTPEYKEYIKEYCIKNVERNRERAKDLYWRKKHYVNEMPFFKTDFDQI